MGGGRWPPVTSESPHVTEEATAWLLHQILPIAIILLCRLVADAITCRAEFVIFIIMVCSIDRKIASNRKVLAPLCLLKHQARQYLECPPLTCPPRITQYTASKETSSIINQEHSIQEHEIIMSYAQRGGEETKYEQEMGPRMTPRTTPRNMPPPSMHSYDRTTPRHMPPPSMHSFNVTTPKSMPPQSMHSFSGTPRNMPPASMHSYDMDDVMVDPYTGLAYKQPPRTTCERHRGKFICLGVTLGLLLVLGILIAIFFPRAPQITLFNSSVLAIDGFTGK